MGNIQKTEEDLSANNIPRGMRFTTNVVENHIPLFFSIWNVTNILFFLGRI